MVGLTGSGKALVVTLSRACSSVTTGTGMSNETQIHKLKYFKIIVLTHLL